MGAEERYHGPGVQAAPDVLSLQTLIANVVLVGHPGRREWALVDTGLEPSAAQIRKVAESRFGVDCPPQSIILTHGHFDHVGAAKELADRWQVPIYVHERELPYVTGRADYPPPDPTVGGGLLSLVSPVYPHGAIDLGHRVQPLPADGSVPGMPGWGWIHTPGHTPGQVALFRPDDRVLISGDALITVKQESALAVLLKEKEIHGPPAYLTMDWVAARQSVRRLEALNPAVVVSGHGLPMRGDELSRQLDELAEDFNRLALPDQGRYVPPQGTAADGPGATVLPHPDRDHHHHPQWG